MKVKFADERNNLKKELECEKRKLSFIKTSENLWNQECERLNKELNTALVGLECARKKNADHVSTSASKRKPSNGPKNFDCSAKKLQKGKNVAHFQKKMLDFGPQSKIIRLVTKFF